MRYLQEIPEDEDLPRPNKRTELSFNQDSMQCGTVGEELTPYEQSEQDYRQDYQIGNYQFYLGNDINEIRNEDLEERSTNLP